MRVLITGGSGTLGRHLAGAPSLKGMSLSIPSSQQFDVTDPTAATRVFTDLRPELVIHCAARIRTRGSESQEDRWAMSRVNVYGTGVIAQAAEAARSRLLYVSTDFVFDGSKPGGLYVEDDVPCPLGYYALSKFGGEAVALRHPDALCVRTSFNASWPYPKAFTDRFTSKLPAAQAAEELARTALSGLTGLLHVGGPRRSYFEFARALGADVSPMTLAEISSPDPLPVDTSLCSERWRRHRAP
ncbi:MAG: sugar nucleotide-binding protein [Polyangiaceae bacterium]